MRANELERLDDFFRPADLGLTVESFRRQFWWLTEYGSQDDPYYCKAELLSTG